MKRRSLLWKSLALAAGLSLAGGQAAGESPAVVMDGEFGDWAGLEPLALDPSGDAAEGGIDLGRAWAFGDAETIHFRVELGRETILQNPAGSPAGNSLALVIDADSDPGTGAPVEGLGAELVVLFGDKAVFWQPAQGPAVPLDFYQAGLVALPTHSATEFEIRLPRAIHPSPNQTVELAPEGKIRFLFAENAGGDRLPDKGFLEIELAAKPAPAPEPIPLRRARETDVRVLCHNVEFASPATKPEPFRRILKALRPDIVAWQEIFPNNWSAEEARDFIAEALPLPEGEAWHLAFAGDCVTVSRWPVSASAGVDGNSVALIDLPEERSPRDLVLFNAHTPCCGNNDGRDDQHDRLAATWRDLLAGEGPFALPEGAAAIMLGDFNMVGYERQLLSLRDGDIFDNEAHGPDFSPGRAAGSMGVAPLRHTHSRDGITWRREGSAFGPGRLDWLFYTPDAMRPGNSFVLWTPGMPADVLEGAGLLAGDSPGASDHLPLVADFDFLGAEASPPALERRARN